MGTEKSAETSDFSTDEYETKQYPQDANNGVVYNGEGGRRNNPNYGDQNGASNHFQVSFIFGLFYYFMVLQNTKISALLLMVHCTDMLLSIVNYFLFIFLHFISDTLLCVSPPPFLNNLKLTCFYLTDHQSSACTGEQSNGSVQGQLQSSSAKDV